jgi:alginate O-acetyltransferase complex protein AlgI
MVFSSVTFLFYFLPIFLVLYFLLRIPNSILLTASLIFYAWGEPKNLLLLAACIMGNYWCGLRIGSAQARGRSGSLACIAGVGINLGCLAYFKYFNFAAASVNDLGAWLGFTFDAGTAVSLPLGISFFTFHAISYLMDVYRKKATPEKNVFALATYIAMFPQLVAGPIVRFSSVAKQLGKRRTTLSRVELGAKLFILGLAQKILLANTVGLPADQIFAIGPDTLGAATAWLGIVCYTLQIYFDFCGYSNMAIGLGLVTGFAFPRNFNYPYIAQSMTEFWRRWHISLSRWFRDYLYIPLGGNRHSALRTSLNLLTVFFLCGLWHGASWSFVVWGLYHGLFLILERIGLEDLVRKWPRPLRHSYTMLAVMIGWVFFRCDSLGHALSYIHALLGLAGSGELSAPVFAFAKPSVITAIAVGGLASTPLVGRAMRLTARNGATARGPHPLRVKFLSGAWSLLIFSFSLMSLASGSYNPFIYFRF